MHKRKKEIKKMRKEEMHKKWGGCKRKKENE